MYINSSTLFISFYASSYFYRIHSGDTKPASDYNCQTGRVSAARPTTYRGQAWHSCYGGAQTSHWCSSCQIEPVDYVVMTKEILAMSRAFLLSCEHEHPKLFQKEKVCIWVQFLNFFSTILTNINIIVLQLRTHYILVGLVSHCLQSYKTGLLKL